MKNSIEYFAKVIDGLDWHNDGSIASREYLAVCIKNYHSLDEVKFPISLGKVMVGTNEQGYTVYEEEFTKSEFNLDWIEANVSDEILNQLWWDACAFHVDDLVDELADTFDYQSQVKVQQVGRSGGWLVAEGVTRDSILDLTMNEVIRWSEEADRIDHLRRTYNPWLDVCIDIYNNMYERDWEDADDE